MKLLKRVHLAILVLLTAAIFAIAQKVEPQSRVELNPPAFPQTYTTGAQNITAAATPTDIWQLTGSSTKVVRLMRLQLWVNQTTAGLVSFQLLRRSSANSGGTCTADGVNPFDTNDNAATATACHYTANPTSTGTLAGTLGYFRPIVPTSTQNPTGYLPMTWGGNTQAPTLRGTSDYFVINVGGATVAGLSYTIQADIVESGN